MHSRAIFSIDEVKMDLKFSKITSIKKSSKKGFEDTFLFVGNVVDKISVGKNTLKKNELIEVLGPKSICYDEVRLLFLSNKPSHLIISNIIPTKILKTSKNKKYSWFLRIKPNITDTHSGAGCNLLTL
tara:strand:+ start:71 stop:454 length:384 start_codon:yes stop_codon:yes gene_type:complete